MKKKIGGEGKGMEGEKSQRTMQGGWKTVERLRNAERKTRREIGKNKEMQRKEKKEEDRLMEKKGDDGKDWWWLETRRVEKKRWKRRSIAQRKGTVKEHSGTRGSN